MGWTGVGYFGKIHRGWYSGGGNGPIEGSGNPDDPGGIDDSGGLGGGRGPGEGPGPRVELRDWRDVAIGGARRVLVSDILSIINEFNIAKSKGNKITLGRVQTLVDSVAEELRNLARAGHRGIYLLDPLHYPDDGGNMVAIEGGKVGTLI